MDHRVTAAIGIMHRELADRVSILRLSRSVNVSSSRLRQLFKKDTGQSPMQYLKNLRMREAEGLLLRSFLSVKEVAFLCGMTDVSHFVRGFKKRHNVTPSQFRAGIQRIGSPSS
jgi:AraC-like DNA-binding protein